MERRAIATALAWRFACQKKISLISFTDIGDNYIYFSYKYHNKL